MDHSSFNLFFSSLNNLCTCYFRICDSLSFILCVVCTFCYFRNLLLKKSEGELTLMGIKKTLLTNNHIFKLDFVPTLHLLLIMMHFCAHETPIVNLEV